jgi:hypothetical protein
MIANTAVLVSPRTLRFLSHYFQAIWLHSADIELVQIGNQTEINYAKRYKIYLKQICCGLRM